MIDKLSWIAIYPEIFLAVMACVILLADLFPKINVGGFMWIINLVLVVLDAAWRSVHLHASLQALLAGLQPHQRVGMVVTGVDPRSPSRRDALAQLRLQWPGQLLPSVLHQDEHLPQAQAQGLCVHQMAPYAQSAHDVLGIANWLEQTLAQLPLVRPQGGV